MMKAKFFLTLLTVSGWLWSATGASAATATTAPTVTNLSQTIANLVDIGDRSLLTAAIDRALLAQRSTDSDEAIINGKVKASPGVRPIINGRIINPRPRGNSDKPIINGIILNPQPEVQKVDQPMINGIIVTPQTNR